jgi:hypothetical protein
MTLTSRRRAVVSAALVLLLASGSVALFATLNAPRPAPPPLGNTFPSAEGAARAVIEAMQAHDLARLRRMSLTEEEFRAYVWPRLPASRPERNVPLDFVWQMLQQNSEGHLHQTLGAVTEIPMLLRSVRFLGEATVYGDVTVHRDTALDVAAPDGTTRTVRLFGSMIEQDGNWKIFSFVVND